MLDVTLDSPEVTLDEDTGSLAVTRGDAALRILEVNSAEPVEIEGGCRVFPPLATRLTAEGSALFGDVYAAG